MCESIDGGMLYASADLTPATPSPFQQSSSGAASRRETSSRCAHHVPLPNTHSQSPQLAVAIARLFEDGLTGVMDHTFHLPDRQALASLIAFNAGAFLGRIGGGAARNLRGWPT